MLLDIFAPIVVSGSTILSMGREASCFVADLVRGDDNSHMKLFEPLAGKVEGWRIVTASMGLTDQRLRCLYDCRLCTDDMIESRSYRILQDRCQTSDTKGTADSYMVFGS